MSEQSNLRKAFAQYAHDQSWSGWINYQFSKCISVEANEHGLEQGSLIIPPELVSRWKRQASTPFDELPESERKSDYEEADKIIAILNGQKVDKQNKPNQIPSVGRIVHYVAFGSPGGEYPSGAHRAAIITEVLGNRPILPDDYIGMWVKLAIFNPEGIHFKEVYFDNDVKQAGTCHWPEYVPAL